MNWLAKRDHHPVCQADGCDAKALWEVGHGSGRLNVCSDCRDGLIEMAGWTLKRSLWNKQRETA